MTAQRPKRAVAALIVSCAAGGALCLAPRAARAHQSSVVYLDVAVDGRFVDVTARIAADDLGAAIGRSPLLAPTAAEALAAAPEAARYVATHFTVSNGRAPCEAYPGTGVLHPRADTGYALAVAVRYVCHRQLDVLGLRYALLFDLDPRHQALADVHGLGAERQLAFRANEPSATVRGEASLAAQIQDYVRLGIEHIFTGYDHVAFLLTLLLAAASLGGRRGVRATLGVVTAFTFAHSLTLLAAALGWARLPSRLIESAIALSIVYVALENVRAVAPRHRWRLAFVFGLIHGFGFAGVLGELGLPTRGLFASLLAFNAGVEVGQLALVLLAYPALALLARRRPDIRAFGAVFVLAAAASALVASSGVAAAPAAVLGLGGAALVCVAAARLGYDRGVRRGVSWLIAALASVWLVERLTGRNLFGGLLG